MMDEVFDRTYQGSRTQLNDGLGRALSRIATSTGTAFRVLNRVKFDAPWKRRNQPTGCA